MTTVMAPLVALSQNGTMLPASIHGHAILNYLIDQDGPVKIEALRNWAVVTHGQLAQYHTCSAQELSFDDILIFFQKRNKVTIEGGSVSAAISHVCSHEDGHHHDRGGHH